MYMHEKRLEHMSQDVIIGYVGPEELLVIFIFLFLLVCTVYNDQASILIRENVIF